MEKLLVFVLGSIFTAILSFWLIPTIEKRKQDFAHKEALKNLFCELNDIKQELEAHIKICFDCLYTSRVEPNKVNWGMVPVPTNFVLDIDFLIDSYKAVAITLTSSQRIAIKSIPIGVADYRDTLRTIDINTPIETSKNITALKMSTQIACGLVLEINRLSLEQERFRRPNQQELYESTRQVLKTLNYTDRQVDISGIDTADVIIEPLST